MEQFLDAVAQILTQGVDWTGVTTPVQQWILGDMGMGAPTALPFGYIIPSLDKVIPFTGGIHGVDMDEYLIDLIVVDDLHKYGSPVPQQSGQAGSWLEQPGYRNLLRIGQAIRAAFRANITLGGNIAKSSEPKIQYVPVVIDNKSYRGLRITIDASMRRGR